METFLSPKQEQIKQDVQELLGDAQKVLSDVAHENQLESFLLKNKEWIENFKTNSIEEPRVDLLTIVPSLFFRSDKFQSVLNESLQAFKKIAVDDQKQVQEGAIVEHISNFWSKGMKDPEIMHGIYGLLAVLKEVNFQATTSLSLASESHRLLVTNEILGETKKLFASFLRKNKHDTDILFDQFYDFLEFVRKDPNLMKSFRKFHLLIQKGFENTSLVSSNEWKEELTIAIQDFRKAYASNDNFKEKASIFVHSLDEVFNSLHDINHRSEKITEVSKKLAGELFLDSEGRPSLQVTQESLGNLKKIVIPMLTENLSYFPIPKIEGSNDTYEYFFENIHVRSKDLVPGSFSFDFGTNLELKTRKKEATHSMGDFLGDFLTFVRLKIENIEMSLKDVEFWFKRKSFPSIEDKGVLDMNVYGPNSKIQIYWIAKREKEGDIAFELYKSKCELDNLSVEIRDSKHSWLLSIITTLFSGAIKLRVEKLIQKYLKEALMHLRIEKNVSSIVPAVIVENVQAVNKIMGDVAGKTEEFKEKTQEKVKELVEPVIEKSSQTVQEIIKAERPLEKVVEKVGELKDNVPQIVEKTGELLSTAKEKIEGTIGIPLEKTLPVPIVENISKIKEEGQQQKIVERVSEKTEELKSKIPEVVDQTKEQIAEKVEKLKDNVPQIVEKTGELLSAVKEKIEETIGIPLEKTLPAPIVENISKIKEKVVEGVSEKTEELKEKAQETMQQVKEKYPATSEIVEKTNQVLLESKQEQPAKKEEVPKKTRSRRGRKKGKKNAPKKKEEEKSIEKPKEEVHKKGVQEEVHKKEIEEKSEHQHEGGEKHPPHLARVPLKKVWKAKDHHEEANVIVPEKNKKIEKESFREGTPSPYLAHEDKKQKTSLPKMKEKEEKKEEGGKENETKQNANLSLPNIPSSTHLESPPTGRKEQQQQQQVSSGKEIVFVPTDIVLVPTDIILVPTDVIVESQMPSHIMRDIKEKLSHSQEIEKEKQKQEEKNEQKEYEKEYEKMTSEGGLGTQSQEKQGSVSEEKSKEKAHHPFEIRQERNPEEEADLPQIPSEETKKTTEGQSYAEAAIHGVLEEKQGNEKENKETIPAIIQKDEKNSESLPLKDPSEFPPLSTAHGTHKDKVIAASSNENITNSPKPQQRISS